MLPIIYQRVRTMEKQATAWPIMHANTTNSSATPGWSGLVLNSSATHFDADINSLTITTSVAAIGDYQDKHRPLAVQVGRNASLVITIAGVRAPGKLPGGLGAPCCSMLLHTR